MKKTLLALAAIAWLSSEPANATLVCSNVVDGGYITEVQSWTVGSQSIRFSLPIGQLTCAADGAELALIQDRFTGIPNRLGSARPVVWTGETALFLVNNLGH